MKTFKQHIDEKYLGKQYYSGPCVVESIAAILERDPDYVWENYLKPHWENPGISREKMYEILTELGATITKIYKAQLPDPNPKKNLPNMLKMQKDLAERSGKYLIHHPRHCTAVVNGKIYDTNKLFSKMNETDEVNRIEINL